MITLQRERIDLLEVRTGLLVLIFHERDAKWQECKGYGCLARMSVRTYALKWGLTWAENAALHEQMGRGQHA